MVKSEIHRAVKKNYLTEKQGVLSWLFTTDHKRIGILYTITITFLFFLGGFFALLMRLELVQPRNWLVSAETYNKLFTMHGIIMVWFFLIPSIPNTIGNFVLPMAIGAKDLAFPKLNLASWYVFMLGAAVTIYALFRGGVDSGWTFYTPFSTTLLDHLHCGGSYRNLHQRFCIHHHRLEFHGDYSQYARAWIDMVPPSDFCLVACMRLV